MAFFPANATYPSMLGELYSAAFTAPAFNWICSPAVTELETVVLDWLARTLHLPDCFLSEGEGGGVIQGSASEATVTVVVAARERYLATACEKLEGREKEDKRNRTMSRLVVLSSDQSHSSSAKAALIAGVRYKSIPCSSENDFAMTGADVQAALEQCNREDLEPFFLLTTLGTTSTCAVDRFHEITAVMRNTPSLGNTWIHVDAAYAGAALVCEEYAHIAKDFVAVDSFDMNMHKWLLTNFDASCLFVRNRKDLTSALSVTPSYLRNPFSDTGLVTDYRDWQVPLGRRFRALKIWFVLRTYGVNGLKAHIRSHITLGQKFADWIRGRQDLFRIIAPPAFALTVVTVAAPKHINMGLLNGYKDTDVIEGSAISNSTLHTSTAELDHTNALTKCVYERINASGEIFLTSTVVSGIYAIRVVSANERTSEGHLEKAFKILVKITEDMVAQAYKVES